MFRLATATTCLALLLLVSGCTADDTPPVTADAGDTPETAATPNVSPVEEDVPEPTVTPLAQTSVRVYFPSDSSDALVAENRAIFETTTPVDRAKQIIAGLIEGPESNGAMRAVPRGTHLRQAYLLADGVAYLDFSRDLVEGLGGGSMREMLTVYAIVDSVARNIPEIRSVGLLIEGKIPDTLNGHLDLRYPLRPNYTIVLAAGSGTEAVPDAEPTTRVAGAGLKP